MHAPDDEPCFRLLRYVAAEIHPDEPVRSLTCESLLAQTTSSEIATGIDEIEPVLPFEEETAGSSFSEDIVAVYYYDLQGRRVGYALQPGEPVIAHIILRNGASIIRKIVAK